VPGTFADERELLALAEPMRRRGAGLFQLVPYGAAGEAAEGSSATCRSCCRSRARAAAR
jgi:hypothetical protein